MQCTTPKLEFQDVWCLTILVSRVEVNIAHLGIHCLRIRKSRDRRGAGALRCDFNATIVSSIPIRGINYYLLIFSYLCSDTKGKARRVPPLNTQWLEKFSGKWGTGRLNTLGSLRLPCYNRSWFDFNLYH